MLARALEYGSGLHNRWRAFREAYPAAQLAPDDSGRPDGGASGTSLFIGHTDPAFHHFGVHQFLGDGQELNLGSPESHAVVGPIQIEKTLPARTMDEGTPEVVIDHPYFGLKDRFRAIHRHVLNNALAFL